MTITITNQTFSVIGLGIGLDFVWCGFWFIRKNQLPMFPKLLGYLIFRISEVEIKANKSKNTSVEIMFGAKTTSFSLLFQV